MFILAHRFRELTTMEFGAVSKSGCFMLWIDAVGGYWVCLGDRITIGLPVGTGKVDVPILGDISPRHAKIYRDGEGYMIEAIRPVRVDGRAAQPSACLSEGCRIELGESVRLSFRRAHALSATARLDFISRHRTQPAADAVLLMADSCVLGPKKHSHVLCRDWPRELIIYRHDEQLYCRTAGQFTIDGVLHNERGAITRDSRISGDGFSLKLESL
ncbi:MAG: hypothetical protein ACWGMZ_05625 [Thermoguttaceae bacterium]